MRTNFHLWSGVLRRARTDYGRGLFAYSSGFYPTLVIDVELTSWALPLAIHAGGPLLGKSGFHVRILCVNIGWSKL